MGITDSFILLCLLLSAFFSGMEIAFISSNRIFIEIEKNKSGFNAKLLAFITKNPSSFITTMLVGNNISLVIYGILMGDKIIQIFFPEVIVLSNLNFNRDYFTYSRILTQGFFSVICKSIFEVFCSSSRFFSCGIFSHKSLYPTFN